MNILEKKLHVRPRISNFNQAWMARNRKCVQAINKKSQAHPKPGAPLRAILILHEKLQWQTQIHHPKLSIEINYPLNITWIKVWTLLCTILYQTLNFFEIWFHFPGNQTENLGSQYLTFKIHFALETTGFLNYQNDAVFW